MIIKRYITREIFTTLMGITMVLLLAFLSQQVVRYLNYVAIGKIPTNLLLELISFEIPYLLSLLLPLGLYLGLLLAYGRLYADSEMSILQMCGFGNKSLLKLTASIALVVAAFVTILMLWINPLISAKRQKLMTSEEATVHLVQTMIPGRFEVSPDGRHVMYVEKVSRDHQRAENVFMAQEHKTTNPGERNKWMLVLASQGYQSRDKETKDRFFVTTDGYRYEGVPGKNDYKIIQYHKYSLRIPQSEVQITRIEDETLPTKTLIKQYNIPKRAAELQWRFSIGIATLLLALLAVPLSTVRPRHGRYFILLPSVLAYILYINMLLISRRWIELSILPISLGMWWIHGIALVFVILAIYIGSRRWK